MTLTHLIGRPRALAPSIGRGWSAHVVSLLAMLSALVLFATGCRKREEAPRPPPGMTDSLGRPMAPAPPPQPLPPPRAPEPPTVYDFEHPGSLDPGALSAPPKAAQGASPSSSGALAVASASDAAAGPDLAQELNAKLADAAGCVDIAQAATQPEGRLTISVTAYVQGSGRVSRASVSAPGQPASALACIQKQVLAFTLAGPIKDSPAEVRGSTELQFKLVGGAADAGPGARPAPPARALNPDIARPAENTEQAQPDPGEVAGAP